MAKRKFKIECCNCGKFRFDYGHTLCSTCYKKFLKGLIEHPDGIQPSSHNKLAVGTAADSDFAFINSGNPFALPLGAKVFPAGADNHPDFLQQENIFEDVDQQRVEFVNELVRAA